MTTMPHIRRRAPRCHILSLLTMGVLLCVPLPAGAAHQAQVAGTAPVTKGGLLYASYLGGNNDDRLQAVAVDAQGNAYIAGYTTSTNFPVTPGAYQQTMNGAEDGFVVKIDPTGTKLLYGTYLGGGKGDNIYAIAVDGQGNVYVAGSTDSPDYPVTKGAVQSTLRGGANAFITSLNATGTALRYSTYLGGSLLDGAFAIAVDSHGQAVVTGSTRSKDFPVTRHAFDKTCGGCPDSHDAFVSELNATGTALQFSTFLGGKADDIGYGIAFDTHENVYVAGETSSLDFPITPGAAQRRYGGAGGDAFIVRMDPTGSHLGYATYLGGSSVDEANGVAVDAAGNAYVTGSTNSDNFPVKRSSFQKFYGGGGFDAFVAKLNAAGSAFLYSTYLGGSGPESGGGITIDGAGHAYVDGWTGSHNFPTTPDAFQTTCFPSCSEAFVTELDARGHALVHSTFLGGTTASNATAIAGNGHGAIYVIGETVDTDFPVTPGAFQQTYQGGDTDGFMAAFGWGK